MLPDAETILKIERNDVKALAELDACGCLPGPDETFDEYRLRISSNALHYSKLASDIDSGADAKTIFGSDFAFDKGMPIPPETMNEAAEDTRSLFGFSTDWVPGYFLSDGLGVFFGGCTVYNEEYSIPFFFIRRDFAESEKYFIYSRRELLAHELCHVARCAYPMSEFEEHFAYMTSPSALRRGIGNFFRKELDAVMFVAPVFLLLAYQMFVTFAEKDYPVWPLWALVFANFAFFHLRNLKTRIVFARAQKRLIDAGFDFPRAILFRCTAEEIHALADAKTDIINYLSAKSKSEFRWEITLERFGREKNQNGFSE